MNKALHFDIINLSNIKVGEKMGCDNMTDNQLKIYNRLLQFIRKLLKLIPDDKRETLEEEFDTILQSNIED